MKTPLLLLAASTLLVFAGCEKTTSAPQSQEVLLTKTWKRGMQDKNTSTNPANVIFYPVQSCEQDDTFRFRADGTVLIDRGAIKCSQGESQTVTQAYSINRITNELTLDGQKFKLLEETGQQVKYAAQLSPGTGYSYQIFLLQ
ncbi:hypothetical protein CDA63_09185 [Hymenobacter amundsenii]|uniref:Lipocalin-like domain-containing protein n=1 Tax=Hymenobacter amundsenii TaxID=2006685 RepID=A0A246FKX1_9BACT|nr:hypothetical protein [Hymenobacter amundsenii]OWP63370.1 hypothetical protein CDA63_09185 [Hymenobacter amundsenii]